MENRIKPFKTLDEQLDYLTTDKNIDFKQFENPRQILFDNNYYNLVSSGKIKFAREVREKKHDYNVSNFIDWVSYFENDCRLNEHLMVNILAFERVINSRTAYLVSELIAGSMLSSSELESLIHSIQGKKNYTNYQGVNTWEHITKKTFGELRNIIKWLWRNRRKDIVAQIIEGYPFLNAYTLKMLDELVNLRNNCFHFRPINIYLAYGNTLQYNSQFSTRKKIVEAMYFQMPCETVKPYMIEIFRNVKKFIDIKNSQYPLTEI